MSTAPASPLTASTDASSARIALRRVPDAASGVSPAGDRQVRHAEPAAAAAPSRATYRRRRIVVVGALLLAVLLLGVVLGRVTAQAELADPVAGQHVVEPGQTLWEVAVDTAPDGVDPRRQLHELRELNDVTGGQVEAWTVLLIPAW